MSASVGPVFGDVADGIALGVVLSEFAMLRAQLVRSQIRIYVVQSLLVAALAGVVAAERGIEGLWVTVVLTVALKVFLFPALLFRMLGDRRVDLVASHRLGVATMVLVALALAAFGFLVGDSLPVVRGAPLPPSALGLGVAAILVAFGLTILRSDVMSEAVGFFSLENAASLVSLVVAAGLPLIEAVSLFFDLLVAIVVFGILIRVHHRRRGSLGTDELDRLRG